MKTQAFVLVFIYREFSIHKECSVWHVVMVYSRLYIVQYSTDLYENFGWLQFGLGGGIVGLVMLSNWLC